MHAVTNPAQQSGTSAPGQIEPFTLELPGPLGDILAYLANERVRRGEDLEAVRAWQREALLEGVRSVVVGMLEGV